MHASSPRAFTLIELLVSVMIIGLLIGILLPMLGHARAHGRAAACASNARQMTTALVAYTGDFDGRCVPNSQLRFAPGARQVWWFGEEIGLGSATAKNRPLDTSRSPLAPYLSGDINAGLQCADFPHTDGRYYPKFSQRSAHYGYNEFVAPLRFRNLPPKRLSDLRQPSKTVAFGDGVHLDGLNSVGGQVAWYEPFYLSQSFGGAYTGFSHFRHHQRANTSFLDGHAEALPLVGPSAHVIAGADAGDVDDRATPSSLYLW